MTVHSDSGASRRSFESWLIAQDREDTSFKQRLLENPKAVIAKECGTQLPVYQCFLSQSIWWVRRSRNPLYLVE
ncbi:MAG TPA: hypothetical protein DCE56_30370 [Cyanobacteria bacterium UBA8553]|nr:hypothetical protein [Cyanobacteria bacterium UBA8553]